MKMQFFAVLPQVEKLERLHADDRLRDGPDGVVVEEQPLQQKVVGAFLRKLCQFVAGEVCKKERKENISFLNYFGHGQFFISYENVCANTPDNTKIFHILFTHDLILNGF
jgi:hypothetical protein